MDLSKHLEFFDPINQIGASIHIIGCGAIGSTVAEMLTRMGVPELHLYDFDTVSPHNIANQMFTAADIHKPKVEMLREHLLEINPEIKIIEHEKGWKPGMRISGYVFLSVDNIDLRRQIAEEHANNPYIRAMFDFRMRLTDAQHYAADWADKKSIANFINTMQFSHDEAKEATPVSACGTTLNVVTTVRMVVACGLGNFINFVKTGKLKKMILTDSFNFMIDAF